MLSRRYSSHPIDPQPRRFKPVGAHNRGKNLAGRFDPDDVPIITQTVEEEIAQDFQVASKWAKDHYHDKFEKPSDFTLRIESIEEEENECENYDPHQHRRTDAAEVFAISEKLGIKQKGAPRGMSIGELSDAPTRGIPRLKTSKTYWAFRSDMVQELIRELDESRGWPKGSDKRAGYVIMYYYLERWEDKEIAAEIPEIFPSAKAVKMFRQRLVRFANGLFYRESGRPAGETPGMARQFARSESRSTILALHSA